MSNLNYSEIKDLFDFLPRDYSRQIRDKFPNISSSRISQIRKVVENQSYNPSSETIDVLSYMVEIAKENKVKIENLNNNVG